jgi:calcium-dependent protein kinase
LYILLSGKVPFPGESNKEIIENVLRGEYHFGHEAFTRVSPLAKDLISKLLVKDVQSRYSAADAYNHPWIQNVQDQDDTVIASDAFDNMKSFMEAVNFKKATLIYLAAKLPEGCIEDLRSLFIKIDINGDGRITADEFQVAIKKYDIDYSTKQMQDLIYMLDINNNGYIDYTEFLAGCMKSKIYLKEENLKIAFSYFDKVSLLLFYFRDGLSNLISSPVFPLNLVQGHH